MSGMRQVLFLDKVLLSPREQDPRGVEVFNLNLLRDLTRLECDITAGAHPTWLTALKDRLNGNACDIVAPTFSRMNLAGILTVAWKLRKRRYPVFLLGNVANRLLPAMALLRSFRVAPRCVLIAHREPSPRFLKAQKSWPTTVLAVNRQIASHFERTGFPDVTVHYGITEADRFHPPAERPDGDKVNFCVVGHLDSAWKGADTAVAAFRALPEQTRRRCRLHLASFHQPPAFSDPDILAHTWMPFDRMPDFLRSMDVMLAPSRDENVMRETFSQTVVQGMLSGLPVVVSSLPILTEKLDRGGGIVFGNERELTEAMVKLAENPGWKRRLGEEGRATALARYVWNTDFFVKRFLFPEGNAGETGNGHVTSAGGRPAGSF